MTDAAPKRIWATEDRENHGEDAFHSTRPFSGGVEYILASEHAALILEAERDAWRKDPESSEAWCFGNQYALDRLCHVLGVDPDKVDWDGSDGSLDEEADSLINRILRANDDADGNSPDVAALIREAEARGMERAVSIMKDAGDSAVTEAMGQLLCCSGQDCGCHGATVEQYLEHIIRSEAAVIRAAKAAP